jgi:hypothetical protein
MTSATGSEREGQLKTEVPTVPGAPAWLRVHIPSVVRWEALGAGRFRGRSDQRDCWFHVRADEPSSIQIITDEELARRRYLRLSAMRQAYRRKRRGRW